MAADKTLTCPGCGEPRHEDTPHMCMGWSEIKALRSERDRVISQRDEYHAEIVELRKKLNDATDLLAAMRER